MNLNIFIAYRVSSAKPPKSIRGGLIGTVFKYLSPLLENRRAVFNKIFWLAVLTR